MTRIWHGHQSTLQRQSPRRVSWWLRHFRKPHLQEPDILTGEQAKWPKTSLLTQSTSTFHGYLQRCLTKLPTCYKRETLHVTSPTPERPIIMCRLIWNDDSLQRSGLIRIGPLQCHRVGHILLCFKRNDFSDPPDKIKRKRIEFFAVWWTLIQASYDANEIDQFVQICPHRFGVLHYRNCKLFAV